MQSIWELERIIINFNNRALNKKRIILPNARMILLKDRGGNADYAKD